MSTYTLNNPKTIKAWCMYDWANSVYSLTITSTIFPIYYEAVTQQADGSRSINILGFEATNTVVYSYALSLSFLLMAIMSPILSGIADYSGRKKQFMQFFCYMGSAACAALFFFTSDTILFGLAAFMMASIGYGSSIVFYNSYLPDIVSNDRADKVSAQGYAYGYVGSVILLIANLLPILQPAWFGNISSGMASRIAFLCTGVWWFGFAQITFARLPIVDAKPLLQENIFSKGFKELKEVWNKAKSNTALRRYLPAFFFFNMGVQTIMYLAALFGSVEIKLDSGSLIATILILQLIAVPGAILTAKLSSRVGNKKALTLIILLWVVVCVAAWQVRTANQFFILAGLVGTVMGGIQSLSRATFAKLIPAEDTETASYFSFYDVVEKMSIVLGTAMYGLVEYLTGSMRSSALALAALFIIGLFLLQAMPWKHVAPANEKS